MNKVKRISAALWLTVGLGIILVGCSQKPASETPIERGKVVFAQKCQNCHIIEGKGKNKGPDLSSTGAVRSREWLETYLKNPFAINPRSKMPRVQMTDQELKDVSAYLAEQKAGAGEQPHGKTD